MLKILDTYIQLRSQLRKDSESASIMEERRSRKDIWSKTIHMNIRKELVAPMKLSFEVIDMQSSMKNPAERKNSENIDCRTKNIETQLKKLKPEKIDDQQDNIELNEVIVLGIIYYNLGRLYHNAEIDVGSAQTYYFRCIELLKRKKIHPVAILPLMQAFYGLSSVYLKVKIDEKRYYKLLIDAVEVYWEYTTEDKYIEPTNIRTILGIDKKEQEDLGYELDNIYTKLLKRLIEIYNFYPQNKLEFVTHMHKFFENRVRYFLCFDNFDVSFALSELTAFFLLNERFMEARNYLKLVNHFTLKFIEKQRETVDYNDKVTHLRFNIAFMWSKYAFMLLRFSKNKFAENMNEDKINGEDINEKDKYKSDSATNLPKPADFLLFPMEGPSLLYWKNIACDYLLNFEQGERFLNEIIRVFIFRQLQYQAEDMTIPGRVVLLISRAFKDLWYLMIYEKKKIITSKQRLAFLHEFIPKIQKCNKTSTKIYNLLSIELGLANLDHYILKQGSVSLHGRYLNSVVPLNMQFLFNDVKSHFNCALGN